ncbi:MAG: sporulation protein YqfC [Clostridia bacterium]|nr:sporulation protein YqfC [Clostridia bacterium]
MKKLKEKLSEALEIPKEISMDYPRLTLIGKDQLYIENGKAIVSYTDTFVQMNTSTYFLKISGENLRIKQMTGELMEIRGDFMKIELEK